MPAHLPPISRRDFLKRSLLAGAGLAFAPQLLGAMRRLDADSWALLADPHIAADASRVARDVDLAGHFRAVSQELLELPKRLAGVFVVGDCALSRGEPGDYATLLRLLEPLQAGGLTTHLALGNHDHRKNFHVAMQSAPAVAGVLERHVGLVKGVRVNWFMLDSLEKTLQTPGLLGEAQLDWLAKQLDAHRDKPALVLVHHNPGSPESNGLKDTAHLLEIIRPRQQVKAYIFGHTHRWEVTRDESGIHLVNLPAVSYVFRPGEPSGWVHCRLSRRGMKLELRSVDSNHKKHGQVTTLAWR